MCRAARGFRGVSGAGRGLIQARLRRLGRVRRQGPIRPPTSTRQTLRPRPGTDRSSRRRSWRRYRAPGPPAEHDRRSSSGSPGLGDRVGGIDGSGSVGRTDRNEPRFVTRQETGQIGGRDVSAKVCHGPAHVAQDVVQADQADHVLLPGDTGEDRERPNTALRSQIGADPVQRPKQGLAREVLLRHAPLATHPALADEPHRPREEAVVDLRPRAVLQGL